MVSIPTALGILVGHINARLPDKFKFKLFDKKNAPTSGDTTSTHDHHHVIPTIDSIELARQEG